MGLFDELKKLTQPQDDDSDFFEGRCFFARFFAILASIKEIYGY